MRGREMLRTYLAVCLFVSMAAVEYSSESAGTAVGLVSDCPDSWKPAFIKPKTLKKLYVSVMNENHLLTNKYDYYQIGNLAKDPDIDFNKKTFLYCGGYFDSTSLPFGWGLGQKYKDLGYNVLLLDTFEFTARVYPQASRVIRPIGKHVAQMLVNLTSAGLDPKKLELVGLSLGSQTMSFIAKNYRQITGKNISSLTSLDAAGPCFRHLGPDQRLDRSDADFVLAVVTNMDGFGMQIPVGHVTFYANGGEYQPGDIPWMPCYVLCSHIRSYSLWLAALYNPGILIGVRCDSLQKVRDGDWYKLSMVTNTLDLFSDRNKPGPGSEKPARINSESLKKLFMMLMGDGDLLRGDSSYYHYYRAEEIPNHPDFDITKKTFLYVGGYWDSTTWGFGRRLGSLYKQLGYNVASIGYALFHDDVFS